MRFIRPKSTRLLMAPTAANSRTRLVQERASVGVRSSVNQLKHRKVERGSTVANALTTEEKPGVKLDNKLHIHLARAAFTGGQPEVQRLRTDDVVALNNLTTCKDLYVLIGGWTHSGGVVFGSYLLNNDNVTFIGEETGGGHDTFTAGNMVLYDLPNTRCQLEVPLIRYENYRGEKAFPKGSGIRPDHPVHQTPQDLIKKVDTVMEFALGLARKKVAAEKQPAKQ